MVRKINELGNRYGRLIVIEAADCGKTSGALWRCICDCGNETVVIGGNLRNGCTKSCGCLKEEVTRQLGVSNKLHLGQANFNIIYRDYRKNAKKRNISFELTKKDFSFLTKMNCHYCGTMPLQIQGSHLYNGPYIYNGVDRIDNNEGYTMDNVVPCCGKCNFMKRDMTVLEFKKHISKIMKHRGWGG